MKKILSLALLVTAAALSGCASSMNVSQYAGLPRDALPKDHLEYVPAHSHRSVQSSNASNAQGSDTAANLSPDQENQRLAKAIRICRDCMPGSNPEAGADTAQASDGTPAKTVREAEVRH
jgi:hypothetical protein